MNNQKTELIQIIKKATNILITVSSDPSVDQLASCIGLTLILNKIDKHATAVFSGQVPSMLDFLQPDQTLEKNTDSLRDFIISLDKNKADKLRYKALDDQVKIFITPYKTSISESDLEFSQGDFNVDLVIVLGAITKDNLDQAIVSHGRILHDAAVVTIGVLENSDLGSVNYFNPQSSSISEIITNLTNDLGDNLLDSQSATAFLTGIVASTDRFSNEKTSSTTLSASASLMQAGANQQLVAIKLAEPVNQVASSSLEPSEEVLEQPASSNEDGNLHIDHQDEEIKKSDLMQQDIDQSADPQDLIDKIGDVLDSSQPQQVNDPEPQEEISLPEVQEINQPIDTDSNSETIINDTHNDEQQFDKNVESMSSQPNLGNETEELPVNGQPIDPEPNIDVARDAVNRAFLTTDNERLKPIDALNAQPLGEINHDDDDPLAEHEIVINNNGEILTHEELIHQSPDESNNQSSDDNLGHSHELTIEPLHDLRKPPTLDETSNFNNLPPPVPPPIPMQFKSED